MRKTRRLLALFAAIALGGTGGALLWRSPQVVDPVELQRRAHAIGRANGLVLGHISPRDFFVPPFHPADALIAGAVAQPAELREVPPALDGTEAALRVYPFQFVAGLCRAIFICGSLTLDGAPAGGTYGRAWIILSARNPAGAAGTYETARMGVHHELSSFIWHRLPALRAGWTALLPAGWTPVQNNADALGASAEQSGPRDDGFLSAYGVTNAENDFNVYAETIFTQPDRLLTIARNNVVVARKTALLMAAYVLVDPRMATVFDTLHLTTLRQIPTAALEEGVLATSLNLPGGEIVK